MRVVVNQYIQKRESLVRKACRQLSDFELMYNVIGIAPPDAGADCGRSPQGLAAHGYRIGSWN